MIALSAVEDGHGRGNAAAVLQGRNGGIRRDRPSDPALITRPPALLSSISLVTVRLLPKGIAKSAKAKRGSRKREKNAVPLRDWFLIQLDGSRW